MHGYKSGVLFLLLAGYVCEAELDTYAEVQDTGPHIPIEVYAVDREGNQRTEVKYGFTRDINIHCSTEEYSKHKCEYYLTYDNRDFLHFNFTVPFNFKLKDAAASLTPKEWVVQMCYTTISQNHRPWRKFDPRFKKDKSCKYSTTIPYVADKLKYVAVQEIHSDTPRALFTTDLFLRCEGQGDHEYCYVSRGNSNYATISIDGRSTVLWVFTLLCGALGPIMYIVAHAYELLILNKS